jgi:uncharacterized membrane protein
MGKVPKELMASYGPTFKDCLHKYATAHYKVSVMARERVKHAIVGALALGIAIVTTPLYLYPNLTQLPTLYGILCLLSLNVATWCGGFLLFNNERFKALKTKEFMALQRSMSCASLIILDRIQKNETP